MKRRWALGSGIVALAVFWASHSAGLRYNHTPSMPKGIWRVSGVRGPLRTGDTVTSCPHLTALEGSYVDPGECSNGNEPLLKRVAAVPGDVVAVTADGISVNGVLVPDSAPLPHDSAGHPLRAFPAGTYTVPAGKFWLVNAYWRSLDGRYTGPVDLSEIQGVATPEWVEQ